MAEKPVKKFRYGSVSMSIFVNKTDKGAFYSTSVQHSYKDKEGNWQSNSSFPDNALPQLALAAQDAYAWLMEKRAESFEAVGGDDEPF